MRSPRSVLAAALAAGILLPAGDVSRAQEQVPPVGAAGPIDGRQRAPDPRAEHERYQRNARVLAKYHDFGTLDRRDLFRALDSAGVTGKNFIPFHVPVFRGRWRWPLRAGILSSLFGPRWGKNHEGLDIAADLGAPVFAAAPGRVVYAGNGLRGYGNVVILRHDKQTTTLYAHNQSLLVREGEDVPGGKVIALLGSTGRSTGPHVHFEIRMKRRAVDPLTLLPKSRFFSTANRPKKS